MINKKNILLTIILIIFIINSELVISSTLEATDLFINKVFMSIFPFIIFSNILMHFNYHLFINKLFGVFLSKLFNISNGSASTFVLSVLSSHPSNAVFIKDKLDNNTISTIEAEKIYSYTFFPSIMFVIGTIGINLLSDIKVGIMLLLCNYLCNIFIGISLRKSFNNSHDNFKDVITYGDDSFFCALREGIIKAINSCFIILGNIVIFTIIINLIDSYIYVSPLISSVFYGLLEMTNGIVRVSSLSIDYNIKLFLISFLLNFSGLAIFFQGLSIISPYKFNYKKILVRKLIFSLLFALIFLFI